MQTAAESKLKSELREIFSGFVGNDAALLDQAIAGARLVRIKSDRFVFHSGDLCEAFLLLLEGSVRVQLTSASGREVTLYRIAPGASCILTTSCLLGDENYPAEAITETDVVAVAISSATFQELLEASKTFRRLVFDGFSTRLKNVIAKIEELAFTAIDSRLARILLELDDQGVEHITHQALSVELGTAREVVSRHLKRFEQERWVDLGRGRITVTDRGGLANIAAAVA